MKGYIGNVDWVNMEPMKYWAYPAQYDPDKKKKEIKDLIFSGNYLGSLKVDGFYQRLLKDEDGNCFMLSRSKGVGGEYANKIDWVPHLKPWLNKLPNGTCFLCEAYIPSKEGSKNTTTILGCDLEKALERQQDSKNRIHLYIYDIMAFSGFDCRNEGFETRVDLLRYIDSIYCKYVYHIYIAEYYTGENLWDELQKAFAEGREGMVIMHKDCLVYEGRTPARRSVKIKREICQTVDCVVIGSNPPEVNYTGDHIEDWKYFYSLSPFEALPEGNHYGKKDVIPVTRSFYKGLAGSLELGLYRNGKLEHFGDLSGLPDSILRDWRECVGRVCEVNGMDIDDETGHIRHPRFVCWREDKSPSECLWEQVNQSGI